MSQGRYNLRLHLAITATLLSVGMPVHAENSISTLEEIVVTARKRVENQQETPISVTAITGETIRAQGLQNITDVTHYAPNVNFSGYTNPVGNVAMFEIRGIRQDDFVLTRDPAVGIYIDGVYYARAFGNLLDVSDIAGIEILRGPQGTLFGKNTEAGAVLLKTQAPSNEVAASGRAQVGSRNYRAVDANITGALSDSVSARLTYAGRTQDGEISRPYAGNTANAVNTQTTRLALQWAASDALKFNFTADTSQGRGTNPEYTLLSWNQAAPLANLYNVLIGNKPGGIPAGGAQYTGTMPPRVSYGTAKNFNNLDTWGLALTTTFDISSDVTLKSITARRGDHMRYCADYDDTPVPAITICPINSINPTINPGVAPVASLTPTPYETMQDQTQTSQEFQLNGKFGRLDLTGGLYYFHENASDFQPQTVYDGTYLALAAAPFDSLGTNGLPCVLVPVTRCLGGLNNPNNQGQDNAFISHRYSINDSYAAYAQGTYAWTDKLNTTLGLRYSSEQKDFIYYQYYFQETDQAPSAQYPLGPKTLSTAAKKTWTKLTPRFDLNYRFTSDLMAYLSASEGFRSGGFNGRATSLFVLNYPFDQETVRSYEMGLKSEWFDHRVRLNADVYYQDYKHIQLKESVPDPNNNNALNLVTANPGNAHIKGFELELTALPFQNFQLSATAGYTNFKFYDIEPGSLAIINSDTHPLIAPEWTYSVAANYRIPLPNSSHILLHADAYYQSEIFFGDYPAYPGGLPPCPTDPRGCPITQGGYGIVNAKLAYEAAGGKWDIFAMGTNLGGKTAITQEQYTAPFGTKVASYNKPLEWRAGIDVKF